MKSVPYIFLYEVYHLYHRQYCHLFFGLKFYPPKIFYFFLVLPVRAKLKIRFLYLTKRNYAPLLELALDPMVLFPTKGIDKLKFDICNKIKE